ncbi:uncharacterized protein LOC122672324 [Telopea speciosissima]|uniref:uncharacterized protein LOC122672324 n=1 Tax=Telopea speciosissima TaxID=54955 RepID=UPI001CC74402|nr:uncharacterized protein LOC122672324 [Telopea speciosissima]
MANGDGDGEANQKKENKIKPKNLKKRKLIEEKSDCFRFIAITEDVGDDTIAHTIEIHPGDTKIVFRRNNNLFELYLDELEIDLWRFRLPPSTRPEFANAVYVDGELIVTVPKGVSSDDSDDVANEEEEEEEEEEGWGEGNGDLRGGVGHLVLVQ